MLAQYIYSEASVSERLAQGEKALDEGGCKDEMKANIEQMEKEIEGQK